MRTELDRLLSSVAEVVLADPALAEALKDLELSPEAKGDELRGILQRAIEDFHRFYVRKHKPEERVFSAQDVAKRWGMTIEWVYHNEFLEAVKFKVGKYNRYKESDLIRYEEQRQKRSESGPRKGYGSDLFIRHRSEPEVTNKKETLFICK